MPKPLHMAAQHLVDVLVRENDALKVMDLRRAATLLPEKTVAIAELAASSQAVSVPSHPGLVALARELDGLASENRRLLERAITAQQRVIGIVVRAAVSAVTQPSYEARGRRTRSTGAMAFSTRA